MVHVNSFNKFPLIFECVRSPLPSSNRDIAHYGATLNTTSLLSLAHAIISVLLLDNRSYSYS